MVMAVVGMAVPAVVMGQAAVTLAIENRVN